MQMTSELVLKILLGSPLTEEESQHMDEMARQSEQERLAEIEMREQKYERMMQERRNTPRYQWGSDCTYYNID